MENHNNLDRWRRMAPLGLWLALLAALSGGGLYIVRRAFDLPVQISLGLVVIGLALFAVLDPQRVRAVLTGRQARYGSNALIITLAFVGILVVLNYLVYQNNQRWDLTEDKANTLADETLGVLGELKEKVTAKAFYTARISSQSARSLLDSYTFHAKGLFSYEFIDPEGDPVAAQQYNITSDGSIVLLMGDRKEPVSYASEQELTSALIRLLSGGTRNVYFLTGHGELSPQDTGEQSLAQFKTTLQSKNYQVLMLNLLETNQVPADATVLVVAGPIKPMLEGEVNLIADYVNRGGALVVMGEPTLITEFGDEPDLLAEYLNQDWGVQFDNDIVVDLVGQQLVGQPFIAVGTQYASHPIVDQVSRTTTFFPTARSITLSGAAQNGPVQVISTSPQSWAETNIAGLLAGENAEQDEMDRPGPVTLVVAGESLFTQARLVVVGDSDFASDGYITANGNLDLTVNIIDWASGQEDLITLTPKQATTRILTLKSTPYTKGLLFLVSVILLPGITLVAGIVVLVLRRRRG